jgi:hypothetical protein
MNCRIAQSKITDRFAAESPVLPEEVCAHWETCQSCREFYESERTLFASLDLGLETLVNEPVPSSLAPRVRARLSQTSLESSWTAGWKIAVLAVATLVLGLGLLWKIHPDHVAVPRRTPIARTTPQTAPHTSSAPSSAPVATVSVKHVVIASSQTEAMPEVIVLAEERRAYARFAAGSVALLPVAPVIAPTTAEMDDKPMEIGLLQIEEIEVQPLESQGGE